MFWLHFVSNNILLYRDTSEAIYRYVYILYRCNSSKEYTNGISSAKPVAMYCTLFSLKQISPTAHYT